MGAEPQHPGRCDAEVGARDRWGSTALADALRGDHVDCARLLGVLDDLGEVPDAELEEVRVHAAAAIRFPASNDTYKIVFTWHADRRTSSR